MNLYKVTMRLSKKKVVEIEAPNEERAEEYALDDIDTDDYDEEDTELEIECLEQETYTNSQELQDEEDRYEKKYGKERL